MASNFVHLHTHTECSLLDGAGRIEEVIAAARKLGQTAMAITDHGVMYGAVDFYKCAVKNGIKPILGCEVYTAARGMYDKTHEYDANSGHLVLLAKNNTGYKNLMKIVSAAHIDGFYYKPRVDFDLLSKHSEGIIALSACLAGDIPAALLGGNPAQAQNLLNKYLDIFGEDFFLEVQYHGIDDQLRVNAMLSELGAKNNVELVATNDVHYVNREDAKIQDVLLCVQTGKTVDEPGRMKFFGEEFYIKSEEEMLQALPNFRNAVLNSAKIAGMCNVELEFGKLHLPAYPVPENAAPFEYLKELCREGAVRKYGGMTAEVQNRLDYELGVIERMGYVDYFLIVWDFVKYAKDNSIAVGPGRGSAAGSIVSYVLDITTVEPLKYGLLFERFLNPERVSMPDIDIDFCYERRGEVIDYVVNKYGHERVAQIITFGTMAARAAIRDVGRALNIKYADVDTVAKLIPFELKITIESALLASERLRGMYESDPQIKELIDTAKRVEGMMRHASTHAAGVIISKEELDNYVPLQKQQDSVTTQFPMGTIEELGLLKMDFLGLRTLTIIRDTLRVIKDTRNIDVNINALDYDDERAYALISGGNTDGVFQLESGGMRRFLQELMPSCFEDIIAGISLYRPGPMASIPTYVRNKNNPELVKYKHELLEDILCATYGCIVYQEQVMQIVQKMAGYSLAQADMVRRAMSKKKKDVLQRERENFLAGCANNEIKIEKRIAGEIFDEILDFAEYAFNKSHAACYAVIAYQTAYLKAHYPTEFMAALLTAAVDNTAKIGQYIEECGRQNIRLLPPDVNHSADSFTTQNNTIRFGLTAIKNVGRGAVVSIVRERTDNGKFASFYDFLSRAVDLNKKTVESLIQSGACDCFGNKRSALMAVYEGIMDSLSREKRANVEGQLSLFGEEKREFDYPDLPEFSKKEMLAMERETIGLYLSGHPLDGYRKMLENLKCTDISSLIFDEDNNFADNAAVKVAGIITAKKINTTKSGAQMAFFTLQDFTASIEVIAFPKDFSKCAAFIDIDRVVCVQGNFDIKEDEPPKILLKSLTSVNEYSDYSKLVIKMGEDFNKQRELMNMLNNFSGGDTAVYIHDAKTNSWSVAKRDKWVFCSDILINELKRILPDGAFELTNK